MDLKIEYDHTRPTIAERLGSTNERWDEIAELAAYAKKNQVDVSVAIEWALKQLKDPKPCELVIVGIMFGLG